MKKLYLKYEGQILFSLSLFLFTAILIALDLVFNFITI